MFFLEETETAREIVIDEESELNVRNDTEHINICIN